MHFLEKDWEFAVAGVYNYKKPGPLGAYFDFVRQNHEQIQGDLLEAGVFRGSSLVAMGLMLREMGSGKKVFGYDTFEGFPGALAEEDNLARFEDMVAAGTISRAHFRDVMRNHEMIAALRQAAVTSHNISSSGKFDGTSLELVQKKIDYFGLENIELVPGDFFSTMGSDAPEPRVIMSALLDCDLHAGYQATLDFTWPRLSPGGIVYLDEYYSLKFPGARLAVNKFVEKTEAKLVKGDDSFGDFERWWLER